MGNPAAEGAGWRASTLLCGNNVMNGTSSGVEPGALALGVDVAPDGQSIGFGMSWATSAWLYFGSGSHAMVESRWGTGL